MKRLKFVAQSIDERTPNTSSDLPYIGLEHVESGTGRLVPAANGEAEQMEGAETVATIFRPGDVLFGKLRPYLAKVFRSEAKGICSTEFIVLRSKGEVFPPFLAYQVLSRGFIGHVDAMTYGTKMPRASREQVADMLVPIPPDVEQQAIAVFLDRETARIDALVEKKERLIALLEESSLALISHAVTKGIKSGVEMKKTEMAWLGTVPRDWDVAPLYARYGVQLGKMLDEKKISGEHLRPYLRNVDVQWDKINTDNLHEMDFPPHSRPRFSLLEGDLVVCEGGEVGRCAIWQGQLEECYFQKALHRLRPHKKDRDRPRFMFYVLQFAAKNGVFVAEGNPNTIDHLPADAFSHFRFAFPPVVEQDSIISFLDIRLHRRSQLIEKIRGHIAQMRERRSALISAAVTGKIDVRREAA